MRHGILIIFTLFLCLACSSTKREYKIKHKFVNAAQYGNKPLTEKYRTKVKKHMDRKKRQIERENIKKDPLRNKE